MSLEDIYDDEFMTALDDELLARSRTDFMAFMVMMKDDYEIGWHHRFLAEKLNKFVRGEIQYLMVFMPPRHGKSEQVSRKLPAFIHGVYPDVEIMAASYNDSLAGDMCIEVQKTIDSPLYRMIFPNTKILPERSSYTKGVRNSTEHTIIGSTKGRYRGQGVGGSFTGKGANFIIIDDPIKGREVADSEAFRERLWNFYNNDLFSRLETNLETGRKGQVLITLTRWHEDDLAGRLLELMRRDPTSVQWDIVEFPALKIGMENKDDPREIGEALWPAKFDVNQLNQIRASSGERAWGSLYQQNPRPAGGVIFKDDMFEFADIPPFESFDYVFSTADTAYKEKQENDYNCFSVWGVIDKDLFLIDVYHKQIKSSELEKDATPFLKQYIKYGYRYTWIEPKGHGIYLNQQWAMKGMMIPTESLIAQFYKDRNKDKSERANNVVPHLAHRVVKVNNEIGISRYNSYTKEDLVAQVLSFPKVKHDDFTDTLVDALKQVYATELGLLDVL